MCFCAARRLGICSATPQIPKTTGGDSHQKIQTFCSVFGTRAQKCVRRSSLVACTKPRAQSTNFMSTGVGTRARVTTRARRTCTQQNTHSRHECIDFPQRRKSMHAQHETHSMRISHISRIQATNNLSFYHLFVGGSDGGSISSSSSGVGVSIEPMDVCVFSIRLIYDCICFVISSTRAYYSRYRHMHICGGACGLVEKPTSRARAYALCEVCICIQKVRCARAERRRHGLPQGVCKYRHCRV